MKERTINQEDTPINNEELSIRRSRIIGIIISLIAIIPAVVYLNSIDNNYAVYLPYISLVLLLVGVLFLLPVNYYIFDVGDWEKNNSIRKIIRKLRLRAIVFNNLSVLILIINISIIIFSFYRLSHPGLLFLKEKLPESSFNYILLASQVGSVIILIFLVQILFRVFKYLIRVGGFYNGKADALELNLLDKENRYKVDILLDSLTPQAYDISDVDSPNLFPGK